MTPRYTLYGSPDSANLVIRIVLHELGQAFETVWLDRGRQQHKQADYLAMNPQGLIPVLVDRGTPIFETAAIALHLCDAHAALAPQSGPARSRFMQWLFFLSNTPHADLRARFNSGRYTHGEAEQAALQAGLARRFEAHLHLIEAELARNDSGPWFLGESLTALDVYLAALCRWWQLYPISNPGESIDPVSFPRLHGLLNALANRPSVTRSCTEESIVAPYFVGPVLPNLPAERVTG
ncbi:MAG: glutathione S-transferase family protein [Pseudomonadota bacterium]